MNLKEAKAKFSELYPNGWVERGINGEAEGTTSVNFGNGKIFTYQSGIRATLTRILSQPVRYNYEEKKVAAA